MRFPLVLFLVTMGLALSGASYSQPAAYSPSSTGVVLSDPQWQAAVSQFQNSIMILSNGLERDRTDLDLLQKKNERLEEKIEELRQNSQNGPNVFDDIKLKGLLNDLKDSLEKSSDLQHQQDNQQKEFEQKALSLIALYNDRIESELQPSSGALGPPKLQLKLDSLALLIQKRSHLQFLLKKYQKKTRDAESLPMESLNSLKTNDRESLQLTQDLIQDRKKALDEQLEKWSIEEDEVKNELKLQGKMQEFLAGIRRMNEDSDFPSGNLNKGDLGTAMGGKERIKLEKHLSEIQAFAQRGQETLAQLNQLMMKIQNQLESSKERKSK